MSSRVLLSPELQHHTSTAGAQTARVHLVARLVVPGNVLPRGASCTVAGRNVEARTTAGDIPRPVTVVARLLPSWHDYC